MQSYIPPSFIDEGRLERLRAILPEIAATYIQFAEKNRLPGYAYGILLDGKLIHSGSGGFADLDRKIPATPRSMFRIASMTKSFTAMAILKLRDEGKLRLDDPVSLYIPEIQNQRLTQDGPVITVRDLLTHSAGLPTDDPWADRKLHETKADLLALVRKGLSFSTPSGTAFEYSNLGYTLLGTIIGKVAGIPYTNYIDAAICKPIKMDDVSWDFTKIPSSQLARGYRLNGENWKEEELLRGGIFGAMGGMITSVESFSRYAALHQSAHPPRDATDEAPLCRSSLREMHQPWRFDKLDPSFKFGDGPACLLASAYSYGLRWLKDARGRIFVGHSGGLPGFGSNWIFLPEYGLGIILFTNLTYCDAGKINLEILDKLVVKAELPPRSLPPSKILQERQTALLSILPHWEQAQESGIFADNFFLDCPIDALRQETTKLFAQAGHIVSVGCVIPENQLRGYFDLETDMTTLRVHLSLTPENPSRIQHVQIINQKPESR